ISVLIAAALPWPRKERPRDHARSPQPGWRVLLWLSLWILLPGYVFYCHSVASFDSPVTWLPERFVDVLSLETVFARATEMILGALLAAGLIYRPTRDAVQKLFVVVALFGLMWV